MSRVRADQYTNNAGTGSPLFTHGVRVTGVATATTFDGNLTGNVTGNADTSTTATTAQGLTGTPNITVGIITSQNILPDGDGTRDLGATGTRWANLYTSDIDLSNESKGGNEIDGTWGSYTIQEGEDDLFLINRRSGKKYKFVLEEVN